MYISAKCSVAVHVLVFIAEYGEERKVTSELLALSTGSNPVTVRGIVSALKKAGLLTVQFGTGGARLCRAPEEITLYSVCLAVEPEFVQKLIGIHPAPSPLCPVGRNIRRVLENSYRKVGEGLCGSLQSVTLADILADYRACLDGEQG